MDKQPQSCRLGRQQESAPTTYATVAPPPAPIVPHPSQSWPTPLPPPTQRSRSTLNEALPNHQQNIPLTSTEDYFRYADITHLRFSQFPYSSWISKYDCLNTSLHPTSTSSVDNAQVSVETDGSYGGTPRGLAHPYKQTLERNPACALIGVCINTVPFC